MKTTLILIVAVLFVQIVFAQQGSPSSSTGPYTNGGINGTITVCVQPRIANGRSVIRYQNGATSFAGTLDFSRCRLNVTLLTEVVGAGGAGGMSTGGGGAGVVSTYHTFTPGQQVTFSIQVGTNLTDSRVLYTTTAPVAGPSFLLTGASGATGAARGGNGGAGSYAERNVAAINTFTASVAGGMGGGNDTFQGDSAASATVFTQVNGTLIANNVTLAGGGGGGAFQAPGGGSWKFIGGTNGGGGASYLFDGAPAGSSSAVYGPGVGGGAGNTESPNGRITLTLIYDPSAPVAVSASASRAAVTQAAGVAARRAI